MRKTQADIECNLWIHGWAEDHQHAGVQIHQLQDESSIGTDGAGNEVGCTGDELGHTVYHDVSTQFFWAEDQRAESVIDYQLDAVSPGDCA